MKKVGIDVSELPVIYAEKNDKKELVRKRYSIPDFLVQIPSFPEMKRRYTPRRGSPLRMR